ncbi:hypothetical protein LTR37_015456 [Vermiconidia calcicola]|uniref:Uncharacterized protein n=1 Tax=Vermiconidia calcicola TaxID=1690605 RepID=A0ACC3MS63_9PEZI|nr:hypothetical protein LTR37_015456 [Vermiconidia calcicola]
MEAAVRWSPHSTGDRKRFLIVDVADPSLTLNEVDSLSKKDISYHPVSRSGRVNNFGAFDWSRTNETIIALGLVSGSANLIRLRQDGQPADTLTQFRIKQQRKCNSIAFSTEDWLAVAVDKTRSDICLFIYDAKREHGSSNSPSEPVRRLCAAEVVSSVKFFPSQPMEIVASTQRQFIRLYDLRDGYSGTGGNVQASTRNVNNITIDPLDENYFASAGSTDDPSVTVWDKRWLSNSSGSSPSGAVFEFRPAVNHSVKTTVWSLQYSGQQRGRLAMCSSTGELNVIDMVEGKNAVLNSSDYLPANPYGGAGPWTTNRYVSETRVLEKPWHDPHHGRDSKKRIIAYDWVTNHDDISGPGQAILALRPNREVDVLRVPTTRPMANITPRDDLSIAFQDLSVTEPKSYTESMRPEAPSEQANGTNAEDIGPYAYADEEEGTPDSMVESLVCNRDSPRLRHILSASTIHRDRCLRGYLFNPTKNAQITAGNRPLERLWEIIFRFHHAASTASMTTQDYDLSYIGIAGLWSENIGPCPRRRLTTTPGKVEDAITALTASQDTPAFVGERTSYPSHRQLCLAVCGWCYTVDALESECHDLISRGLYYQAIVQAVLHDYKHIALNLLRTLIRSRTIQNIGLGALLAADEVNEEQREMCMWMAADTEDPALKALLTFLASGDWRDVMKTNYLHLGYRLALGLKYLNDTELSGFIQTETARAIKKGGLEGILLTGLGERAMDLFQTYITRTNDLQTAVLAMGFTCPLFVEDVRWGMWKETYFMQMQGWRCFVQRTKFTVQHNRMARTREGESLVEVPPAQVTLRCLNCQGSLGRNSAASSSTGTRIPNPPANAGTICPRCGRHMPRCGLCQLWLGTPDPATAKELLPSYKSDVMAKLITFCKRCGHGFHAHHAREWFAKFSVCPVVGCGCACGNGM